jgi:hypothetical protein
MMNATTVYSVLAGGIITVIVALIFFRWASNQTAAPGASAGGGGSMSLRGPRRAPEGSWPRRFNGPCCLSFALLTVSSAYAQAPVRSGQQWAMLQQVPAGVELKVAIMEGAMLEGRLDSVSDVDLMLRRDESIQRLKRDEIHHVWQVSAPSRTRQIVYTSIGAGAGLLAAFLISPNVQCGDSCTAEMIALLGLPAGGGIVGWMAAGKKNRTLIYSGP